MSAAEGISVDSVLVESGREGALGASVVGESGSVVVVKKAEVKTSVVEGGRSVEGECSEVCGVALESILEAIEELKRCFVSEVNDLKSVVKKQEIEIRSLKCGGGGPVSGEAHARDVPGGVPERDVPRATTKALSKSPGIAEWKVVDHDGARPKEIKVNNDHVVCTNSFQVLSGLQEEDTEVRTVDDTSLPEGKILVVGDSQIRHLGSRFCDRDGMRMKSGCGMEEKKGCKVNAIKGRAVTAGNANYEGLGRHLVEISGVGGKEGKEGPKISAAAAGKANYTGLERHLEVINDGRLMADPNSPAQSSGTSWSAGVSTRKLMRPTERYKMNPSLRYFRTCSNERWWYIHLWTGGLSFRSIAKLTGRSPTTVRKTDGGPQFTSAEFRNSWSAGVSTRKLMDLQSGKKMNPSLRYFGTCSNERWWYITYGQRLVLQVNSEADWQKSILCGRTVEYKAPKCRLSRRMEKNLNSALV
ncbi:hypothetical protein GWK47_051123 [Chionoecetes opilio]|uniref:Uncharacterized protein n=1 Tax=Chionoecetes opilio TaxID=41210 RepID=A0A8J4Y126_CHIOP|nr:hypothetical protein GWK47_051123 [Chionoecetes opilio]